MSLKEFFGCKTRVLLVEHLAFPLILFLLEEMLPLSVMRGAFRFEFFFVFLQLNRRLLLYLFRFFEFLFLFFL